jgi:iron complex outermembrane recepter protein
MLRPAIVVSILLSFLSLAHPAFAARTDAEELLTAPWQGTGELLGGVFDLGRIIIGGKRLGSPFQDFVAGTQSNSQTITRGDIERSGAKNIPEALEEVPGASINDLSGNGEESTVDLRGFNQGRDVIFTLDGVRLNEPKSNNVNFPLIPLSMLERMDVIRGGSSFLYGESALGGVANLVTPAPVEPGFHGRVSRNVGSFETWGQSAELSDRRDDHALYVAADIHHSDGFRENSSVDKKDLYTKFIRFTSDTSRLTLSHLYAQAELGRSGSIRETLLRRDGREATERPRNFGDLEANLLSQQFEVRPIDGVVVSENLFYRQSHELSVANFATFERDDNELDLTTDSWGLTVQAEHSQDLFWGLTDDLLLGVEYADHTIDEEDFNRSKASLGRLGTTVDSESSKKAAGIFAKASVDWSDRVGAYYGVRYDAIDFENLDRINAGNNVPSEVQKTSHALGVSYQLTEPLALTANYNRSFRAPTLSDLYANPLFGGNPRLRPEESEEYDAGFKWKDGPLVWKTSVFYNERKDEIGFDPNLIDAVHLFGGNNNFGKTERTGIETYVEYRAWKELRWRASHTYIEALFASDAADGTLTSGRHIPMVPRNRLTTSLLYEPLPDWTIDLRLTAVDKQVLTNDLTNERNGRRLPAYAVLDLGSAYRHKGWKFTLEVRNVLDERYESGGSVGAAPSSFNTDRTVEDNFFVPAPGRSYGGSVSYAW